MSVLNYVKTIWKASKGGGTPFSPANLNNIENGIEASVKQINSMPKILRMNSTSEALNILDLMENSEIAVFYMNSTVSNAFFGISAASKGIVSKTSTGAAYDFLHYTNTGLLVSRYVTASKINTIYKASMSAAQEITVN